jgi:benzoylformate decarboxylase
VRIETHASLIRTLDDVIPGLAGRGEPLLPDIAVAPDTAFAP